MQHLNKAYLLSVSILCLSWGCIPSSSDVAGAYQLVVNGTVHEVTLGKDWSAEVDGVLGVWRYDGGVVYLTGVPLAPESGSQHAALVLRVDQDLMVWDRSGDIGVQKLLRLR